MSSVFPKTGNWNINYCGAYGKESVLMKPPQHIPLEKNIFLKEKKEPKREGRNRNQFNDISSML